MIYDTDSDHWLRRVYMSDWHNYFLNRFHNRCTLISKNYGYLTNGSRKAIQQDGDIYELQRYTLKHLSRYLSKFQAQEWIDLYCHVVFSQQTKKRSTNRFKKKYEAVRKA